MPQVKTSVSISSDLFYETSEVAKELDISRSSLVELALEQFLQRHKNQELLEKINAAYASPLTGEEKETLSALRLQQRRQARGGEWR